jgi:4-amino-4-deoxy-L-arabinose transferase-like glycosyltransferase
MTKRPWEDEAFYSNSAYNLAFHGSYDTTAFELRGFIQHPENPHMYMQPPLYGLVTAGWFKVFGFGAVILRLQAVFWGMLTLLSLWLLLRSGGIPPPIRLAVTAFVSTDYFFLLSASDGRMDMMCTALGTTAIAAYMVLREKSLPWALIASHTLIVASGLTHPTGIIYFCGLVFLTLYYDRARLRMNLLPLVVLPYLVGAGAWGVDIMKDPESFRAQFGGNITKTSAATGASSDGSVYLVSTLKQEALRRYGSAFGFGPGVSGINRVKTVILLSYVVGLLGIFLTPSLRRDKFLFALACLTLIYIFVLGLTPSKNYYYLVNTTIPMATCLGLLLYRHPLAQRLGTRVCTLLLVGLACIQVGGLAYKIRQDPYHKSYLPMIEFVRENATPQAGSVMGVIGLWFHLYDRPFIQDTALGYYSGRKADLVVVDPIFRSFLDESETTCPECFQHISKVLQGSKVVLEDGYYTVYKTASLVP